MEATNVMTNHTPAIRAVFLCCGDCAGKEIVIPSRTPTTVKSLSDGTVRYRHQGQHVDGCRCCFLFVGGPAVKCALELDSGRTRVALISGEYHDGYESCRNVRLGTSPSHTTGSQANGTGQLRGAS